MFSLQDFKNIPDFQKYHHFMVDSAKPGIVTAKELFDSVPKDIPILKKGVRSVLY